jgi:hypothetical protein
LRAVFLVGESLEEMILGNPGDILDYGEKDDPGQESRSLKPWAMWPDRSEW